MAPGIDIGFNSEEFMALPLEGRIRACTILAQRAHAMAAAADEKYQPYYLAIANEWLNLAAEMQDMREREREREISDVG